jgi:hypothetical protein
MKSTLIDDDVVGLVNKFDLTTLHLHLNEHQYSHSVLPQLTCPTIRVTLAQFILRCDTLLKLALVPSRLRASNLSTYEYHIITKSEYWRDHSPCLYDAGPGCSTQISRKLMWSFAAMTCLPLGH